LSATLLPSTNSIPAAHAIRDFRRRCLEILVETLITQIKAAVNRISLFLEKVTRSNLCFLSAVALSG
jgi:hypothetical protein